VYATPEDVAAALKDMADAPEDVPAAPEDMPAPLEGRADAPEDMPAAPDEVTGMPKEATGMTALDKVAGFPNGITSKPEDLTATAAHADDVEDFSGSVADTPYKVTDSCGYLYINIRSIFYMRSYNN
jgi:hypothetical protein